MPLHLICSHCGSNNVRVDAYASWSSEEGDWVLHSVNDARYCENCERETSLLETDEETEMEIGFFGMIKDEMGRGWLRITRPLISSTRWSEPWLLRAAISSPCLNSMI